MASTKLLIVGWDAADWKVLNPLLERGEMPVFNRLVERGVIADMATLDPVLSPMLWNSIATGKRADEHGILGFTEVDPVTGRVRPVTSTSRRVKALWNILSQNGIRTNVVGWFGGHPAEPIRGTCVSDAFARGCPSLESTPWPILPGTVSPGSLAETLEELRIRPQEIDEQTFRLFVPRLENVDRKRPNRLPMLASILAECFTTHAAATWVMENSEWDFMAVYYIGIDHFSHGFMNFHPPKPEWVDEKDFELYRDVVNSGYRLMDLFLARLMELAGPDTTVMVISDHGFHSDHLRPARIPRVPTGPASQHRPIGVLAMAGEGIKKDERIYGVNLLDVAPTVLGLFGLPAGEDMPGRLLIEAFEKPPSLARVPSWDRVDGESGSHPPDYIAPADDYDRLIEQFVALGYVDPQPENRDQAAAISRRESKWNLARVHMSAWQFEKALETLEELAAEAPDRSDFMLALADCQLRLGLYEEAEATAARAAAPAAAVTCLVRGRIAFERRRYRESVDHFLAAGQAGSHAPELHTNLGLAWLKLRRWADAENAFATAMELDPHSALAHQGMARVRLRQGRAREAAECALTSIACRHDVPFSHFWLGVALARLGDVPRAIQAFETSLTFHPPLRVSHKMLAAIYGATPKGDEHRRAANEFFRLRREELRRMEGLRQRARHKAIDRAERTPPPPAGPALDFIIVSGLPRSGTSLMMRILDACGVPVKTDELRQPDDNNPEGYYEWEAIKKVGTQPDILLEAKGKAIKVISMLLTLLPPRHRYKVIFMDRPVEEVAASQSRMLNRPVGDSSEALRAHRAETLHTIRNTPGFEVLVVDYPELVLAPEKWSDVIGSFLGIELTAEKVASVIRPELYRNRGVTG